MIACRSETALDHVLHEYLSHPGAARAYREGFVDTEAGRVPDPTCGGRPSMAGTAACNFHDKAPTPEAYG